MNKNVCNLRSVQFAFANCNSVLHRVNEINQVLNEFNLDIVGLVETRLKPNVHVVENRFLGYMIHRHDRVLRGGGGVALMCKSFMNVGLVCCSSAKLFSIREFCMCLVFSPSLDPLLVLVMYGPLCTASYEILMQSVT